MIPTDLSKVLGQAAATVGPAVLTKVVEVMASPREDVSSLGTPDEIIAALNLLTQDPTRFKETVATLGTDHRLFLKSIVDKYGSEEDKGFLGPILEKVLDADTDVTKALITAAKQFAIAATLGTAAVAIAIITRPLTLNEQVWGRKRF